MKENKLYTMSDICSTLLNGEIRARELYSFLVVKGILCETKLVRNGSSRRYVRRYAPTDWVGAMLKGHYSFRNGEYTLVFDDFAAHVITRMYVYNNKHRIPDEKVVDRLIYAIGMTALEQDYLKTIE